MSPDLSTTYNDDNERLEFLDSGFPTEARVKTDDLKVIITLNWIIRFAGCLLHIVWIICYFLSSFGLLMDIFGSTLQYSDLSSQDKHVNVIID